MDRPGEVNTAGDRWNPVPVIGQLMHTGSITGVWVPRGQRVQWIYTHGLDGSYISGYTLEPLLPKPKEKKEEEEDNEEGDD